jgi:hypothetical protein
MKSARFTLLLLTLFGCNPEVDVDDVFTAFTVTPEAIFADGQTIMEVKAVPLQSTSADRSNIVFKTTGGVFVLSGKSEETVKATFVDGELVATARLRAPISPGDFTVSAEPEFDSPVKDYRVTRTISPATSLPVKISVETSASGIGKNALTEVLVTGTLLSDKNSWVTRGVDVTFEDVVGASPGGGIFRSIVAKSGGESTVSAYYAAGDWPVGTSITINVKATNYEALGTVTLVVNQ